MFNEFRFSDFADRSGVHFIEAVRTHKRISVRDLKVLDLAVDPSYANGIYVFFDQTREPLYVGKCSSRSFLERVPAHFDARDDAWMNQLLRKLRDAEKMDSFQEALRRAQQFSVCIVPVDRREIIGGLEGLLRFGLEPKLNPCSKAVARRLGRLKKSAKLTDILEALYSRRIVV